MNKKSKYLFFISITLMVLVSVFSAGCFLTPNGSLYITSNPSGAMIYIDGVNSGFFTPSLIKDLKPGSYAIGLSADNPPVSREGLIMIIKNQTVSLHLDLLPSPKYRALFVGVDDYRDPGITDLRAPQHDVDRMVAVFENCRFGFYEKSFVNLDTLIGKQATKNNILESIHYSFSQAMDQDVSYFYFSGHGYNDGQTSTLLPHDALAESAAMDITAKELSIALGDIPGTKVVILDSCFSGGFIGKDVSGFRMNLEDDDLQEFMNHFIHSFAIQQDLSIGKDNLVSESFQVIVSASGDQECWETFYHPIDGNPYGFFSASLSQGCGYDHFTFPFPADSNEDQKITLDEAYRYIKDLLKNTSQDVQVYPENSPFPLIEY